LQKQKNTLSLAWLLALLSLAILVFSTWLILLSQTGQDERYSEVLGGAITGLGAPILGLVILKRQPHNRIGWLWLIYGLSNAFFSLAFALKYQANSALPAGYSDPLFIMLLFSETAAIIRLIFFMLLILWFPDGQPPSPRWKWLHGWAVAALVLMTLQLFSEMVPWTEVEGVVAGAPTITNPIGFLPAGLNPILGLLQMVGFFSILAMSLLSILSIIQRFRSARQLVRAQILWFLVGSVCYAFIWVAFLLLLNTQSGLAGVLGSLAILPFYLAVGIAITRYRLYDINIIIRRTLVYGLLTAALAVVFLGGVTLLQAVFQAISGQQSPISIILTTLAIAALFNPLRTRIQNSIDRRFYRKKYDAQKALEDFALLARNEVELEQLTETLLNVVNGTVLPEKAEIWLFPKG
jgi:hypothetical protein